LRIVVPLAPGGNVDLVVRSIAPLLSENLGQQVVVENRPGASSLVGTQLVAKAPPDGYTLLAMANTFAMVPSIVANPGYDPLKDFTGVTLTCLVPQVLVVNPSLPVRTVKQLIALAKSRPGTGVVCDVRRRRHRPHGDGALQPSGRRKDAARAVQRQRPGDHRRDRRPGHDDVRPGEHVRFPTSKQASCAGSQSRAARAPRCFPICLPSMRQACRDTRTSPFNGLVAPAGTPRDILLRLNEEIAKVLRTPALRNRFLERGVELKASASPEEFTAHIKAEFDKKSKLARDAGHQAGVRQERGSRIEDRGSRIEDREPIHHSAFIIEFPHPSLPHPLILFD
jgi:tripartite-type tricarboxylate transporter receptor subunit TctC